MEHYDEKIIKEKWEVNAKEFAILGPASIVYAVVFVFCLHKNFSGITNPICAIATVIYMLFVAKQFEKKWSAMNTFLGIAIILLGISNFVTGNEIIIFFNYIALICLIVTNMTYLFFDTKRINVTKHLALMIMNVIGGISECVTPFSQAMAFFRIRSKKQYGKILHVVTGIIIAIPMMIMVIILLASADGVFLEVFREAGRLFSIDVIAENIFGITIMLIIGFVAPYALTKYLCRGMNKPKEGKSANNEPIVAVIVTAGIAALYVLFSLIQIVYLFMGRGILPSGYTYAQYAREGFFQLLFVSMLNAFIIVVCIEFFRDSKILKIILTIVSICTFVIIASSAYRMGMYINNYGLTRTRLFVIWALIVIAFIVTGLLIQLFNKNFNLFRYSVVIITICFLILSLGHVDYFIAKYDLNMYERIKSQKSAEIELYDDTYKEVDYDYLMLLSTDAAPAIMEHKNEIYRYMEENEWDIDEVSWSYRYYKEEGIAYNEMTARNFNISRYIARLSVEEFNE